MGYSPWGPKESDPTEQPSAHTHTHTQIAPIFEKFYSSFERSSIVGKLLSNSISSYREMTQKRKSINVANLIDLF